MFIDKLFTLISFSTCLFAFYMVTISGIRFLYSDSMLEKFGIVFMDFIVGISVVMYLAFAKDLITQFKNIDYNSTGGKVHVSSQYKG